MNMLSNPLIAFANNYNFTLLDDCAYGVIDSYLVSVSNTGYKKTAFINFFTPESEDGDAMTKLKLSEEIKALELPALVDYEVLINGIVFTTSADLKEFDEAVLDLCALLKKNSFPSMPVCSECGYEVPDDYNGDAFFAIINNRALYTCDSCGKELKEAEGVDKEPKLGSKKLGIVGALVGSLVAALIIVLLYVFVMPAEGLKLGDEEGDAISALLFAIPLSALLTVSSFGLYRLFTKRKGVERLLPCFAFSTLFTIISIYASSAVLYTKCFHLTLSQAGRMFSTIIASPFTDPFLRKDFIRYGLYSLACVIAVTLVYSIIFDTKKPPKSMFIPAFEETVEEGAVEDDNDVVEENSENNVE